MRVCELGVEVAKAIMRDQDWKGKLSSSRDGAYVIMRPLLMLYFRGSPLQTERQVDRSGKKFDSKE